MSVVRFRYGLSRQLKVRNHNQSFSQFVRSLNLEYISRQANCSHERVSRSQVCTVQCVVHSETQKRKRLNPGILNQAVGVCCALQTRRSLQDPARLDRAVAKFAAKRSRTKPELLSSTRKLSEIGESFLHKLALSSLFEYFTLCKFGGSTEIKTQI